MSTALRFELSNLVMTCFKSLFFPILVTLLLLLASPSSFAKNIDYADPTYQFSFTMPAGWTQASVKQSKNKSKVLKKTWFQFAPKSGQPKVFLKVEISKNDNIKHKGAFHRLIQHIATKRNIIETPFSKPSAVAVLTHTSGPPYPLYLDLNKNMLYGVSEQNIKGTTFYGTEFLFVAQDSTVTLLFITKPEDYYAALPQLVDIAGSLHFEPGAVLAVSPPWYMNKNVIELAFNLGSFLFLITLGFGAGTFIEKRHYASIRDREQKLMHMPAITSKLETVMAGSNRKIIRAEMVHGSVVLTEDFFKGFLANLKNFFGGNLTSYESLMDRARREAILRMKADALTADMIVNVRMESTSIGKEGGIKGKDVKSVEMMAYGTAITFGKESDDQVYASGAA